MKLLKDEGLCPSDLISKLQKQLIRDLECK